jgi:hypothetical protein
MTDERFHGSATVRVPHSGRMDISIPIDEGGVITAVCRAGILEPRGELLQVVGQHECEARNVPQESGRGLDRLGRPLSLKRRHARQPLIA